MFGKKQQSQPKPIYDYTKYTEDLGFLNLILSRKKGITREYLIKTYSRQKSDRDYLTDEEIAPIIEKTIQETLTQISGEYKTFLINKYFGSEENLVRFITEDVYVDLVTDSINQNVEKIKNNLQRKLIESVSKPKKK